MVNISLPSSTLRKFVLRILGAEKTHKSYDLFPTHRSILAAPLDKSSSRVHIPLISLSAQIQFRRVLSCLLHAAMSPTTPGASSVSAGLKKIHPYWYPYTTMAKGRWLDREILEVVSTEFRDRSVEYYVRCCHRLFCGPCECGVFSFRDTPLNLGSRRLMVRSRNQTRSSVMEIG